MNILLIKSKQSQINLQENTENYTINSIEFDFDNEEAPNIDTYITSTIIPLIAKSDFDLYVIDIALSETFTNYYGLYLSHHIRLEQELGEKRLLPIILISKRDACYINNSTMNGRILFTKGTSVVENKEEVILERAKLLTLKHVRAEVDENFLNQIYVHIPDSSHIMANEWAIYKWSKFLGVNGTDTKRTVGDIKSRLDFKYLQKKYAIKDKNKNIEFTTDQTGKVLLIDDEWNKGWKEVFGILTTKMNEKIEFKAIQEIYENKSEEDILNFIKLGIEDENFKPDIVLLDLRLHKNDENRKNIDDFTGIKVIDLIKSINPGIQIIMLTATSRSTILDRLYRKGILGFIKKEHPENYLIDTSDNIEKTVGLIADGLERKYLKDIWRKRENIVNILKKQLFLKFDKIEINSIGDYTEIMIDDIKSIFNILDKDMENKFVYSMLTMNRCIENINNIFIKEKSNKQDPILYFWDSTKNKKIELLNIVFNKEKKVFEHSNGGQGTPDYQSTRNKINAFMYQRLKINNIEVYNNFIDLISFRNDYIHANKNNIDIGDKINKKQIEKWFASLAFLYNEMSLYVYHRDIPIQKTITKKEPKKLKPSLLKKRF